MKTNYDGIAEEYKRAKQHPWRKHIEHYTLFELLGDLTGKSVLDLACGEGFLTRFLKLHGAGRVLGVDMSGEMIKLARQEELRLPLGIKYCKQNVLHLDVGNEQFDVVTAAYLLNYARDAKELLSMCQHIANSLKPGGRFISVNNNPLQLPQYFRDSRPYGLVKEVTGELVEGAPVVYRFYLEEGEWEFTVTNYHLSVETHELAFQEAGMRDLRWHQPQVNPTAESEYGQSYWAPFLSHPPVIFIEATRR